MNRRSSTAGPDKDLRRDRIKPLPLGADADATIEAASDSVLQAHSLVTTLCSLLRRGGAVSDALVLVRRVQRLLDHAEWALVQNSGELQ